MICQHCGKNPATTRIKRIANGELSEIALCGDCARKLGYGGLWGDWGIPLSTLFGGMMEEQPERELRCPVCGSWREAESCPRCEERARYRAAIERDPVGFFRETFGNCGNVKQRLLDCYDAYCEKAERENDPMTAEFLRQSEREFFESREKGGGGLG